MAVWGFQHLNCWGTLEMDWILFGVAQISKQNPIHFQQVSNVFSNQVTSPRLKH